MQMKRVITQQLIDWKNNPERKPLLLQGIRNCGKTWILKEFGNQEYEDVAYFNFEENDHLHSIFNHDLYTNRILFELSLVHNHTILPEKTLIIFDEIQACPRAITSLKYFCENANTYHIACASSLLGVSLNEHSSFPVGKIDFLNLYPMSFSEFLLANGEDMVVNYLHSLKRNDSISSSITNKLHTYLKQYFITGGIPEVVESWVQYHNFEKIDKIQQMILDSYQFDFSKHAPIRDVPKIDAIWKFLPEQLSKENKKFIFGQVKQGYRAHDLEDALIWLENAGLIYKINRITRPFLPLSSYSEANAFKVYLCDIGLLRKLSKLPYETILNLDTVYALTENFVLNELFTGGIDSVYYWPSNATAEVDFVAQSNTNIVPIEVKSSMNVHAKSLRVYQEKYNPKYAVKTSLLDEVNGDTTVKIPLYLIHNMNHILE